MDNKLNKPILDPVVQKFVDALAKKATTPLYKLPVNDARKVLTDVQSIQVEKLPVDIEDLSIQGGPKGTINIRIIRPKGITKALPVILYIHGGGWVLGDKETHDRLVREIVHGTQAAVVFVDYTRAPEGQYPVAHEEGYAVAEWITKNSKSLNLDSSRMAIVGDSVGGLIATAITMMSKERGGPRFVLQVLLYPVTNAQFNTPSYEQFAAGPWLTKAAMEWFWDNYVPDKKIRTHPFVSPLQASLEQLKNLPPALIFVNEVDVLRDEGEAYAHKLIQAGVPVVAFRTLGMIHDAVMLNPLAQAPSVRQIIAQANQMLINAFAQKK